MDSLAIVIVLVLVLVIVVIVVTVVVEQTIHYGVSAKRPLSRMIALREEGRATAREKGECTTGYDTASISLPYPTVASSRWFDAASTITSASSNEMSQTLLLTRRVRAVELHECVSQYVSGHRSTAELAALLPQLRV